MEKVLQYIDGSDNRRLLFVRFTECMVALSLVTTAMRLGARFYCGT